MTNAIGIGGRDLNAAVGGITMMDMIDAMEDDDAVKVLVIVSKPPAKEVRDKIAARLSNFSKPIITLFVGEKPEYHEENFYHAYTLDEAARLAVSLVRGEEIPEAEVDVDESQFYKAEDKKTIKAYYSGGTLANEAAMLIKDAMDVKVPPEDIEGYMLQLDGNVVVDLGDDVLVDVDIFAGLQVAGVGNAHGRTSSIKHMSACSIMIITPASRLSRGEAGGLNFL